MRMDTEGKDMAEAGGATGESTPKKDASSSEAKRKELSHAERLESLRTRLYERGATPEMRTRHSLREEPKRVPPQSPVQNVSVETRGAIYEPMHVPTPTPTPSPMPQREVPQVRPLSATPESSPQELTQTPMTGKKHIRAYRGKFVLLGVMFFLGALGISSLFMFNGNNLISGENITLDISGPLTVGGGEELQLQIAVSNQNTIAIDSATLIIEFPAGTKSVDNVEKELFAERQQLSGINTGEVLNIPVKARVFGEENEEKIVRVSVEYRVAGSNATFFKEAEPLRFKISSSPVVLSVDSVKSISSGQEVEIELTVGSNAPSTLTNVLIKATYPETGFDFSGAEPEAVSGQDTWLIKELAPEAKKKITIRGIVVGKQDEERAFTFAVGVPSEKNSFNLFSVFTTVKAEIALEQPFLDLDMLINGDSGETVVVSGKQTANINIKFNNSLDDTLYNGTVEVKLRGNSLDDVNVDVTNGFYNSSNNTITWDGAGLESLEEMAPGRGNNLLFQIETKGDPGGTPEITFDVTAKAQRIFEDRVPQELVGTISRKIRFEGGITLTSAGIYSDGPFTNSGPTPPVAGEVTTYTYLLTAKNGTNNLTGAAVTAVIPQYMTWLDNVSSGDEVTYNPVNRTMTWDIGEMDAREREEVWVQVSFKPSLSQVNMTPTILESQRFKATDKFTGTVIRTESSALTTALRDDPDEDTWDGKVKAP